MTPDHLKQTPWLVRNTAKFIFIYIWGWQLLGDLSHIKKAVVIGVPHTSNWDAIPAFLAAFAIGVHFRWMGKKSLFRFPLNLITKPMGGIPIDRSSSQNAVEQMITHMNVNETLYLCIAPEGTRKRAPYWKTGFYHIAVGAEVPIICAKIDWGRRAIDLSTSFVPTGNIEADLDFIRATYQGVGAKRPENFGEIAFPPQQPLEALPQ